MPPARVRKETPTEGFETLRQCFDVVKEKHTDPWCWHDYLADEPVDDPDDDDDPEAVSLKPKKRSNLDRFKAHLLSTVAELTRTAEAADMAYFHLCTKPEQARDYAIILGTGGDIDAELLEDSGDASPARIMAALQKRLEAAYEKIAKLEEELDHFKDLLSEERFISDDYWKNWQNTMMLCEDVRTKLYWTRSELDDTLEHKALLERCVADLCLRLTRASRLMLYKGRQMMRDQIFKQNPKENLFWAFYGFMFTLQKEKEERIRREMEAERDAVEFALRNEVRHLLGEIDRTTMSAGRITIEMGNLKSHCRALACRFLYKYRPFEIVEYFLWIWELWQPIRQLLRTEKELELQQTQGDSFLQELIHSSGQLVPMAKKIDDLNFEVAETRTEQALNRREIIAQGSKLFAHTLEVLFEQRKQELAVLARLHVIDVEAKEERIAVLEREIAEDKHIQSLKGMVVDLESRLRRALDRRKQKGLVVPEGLGPKCVECGRESIFRGWRGMPKTPDLGLSRTASDVDLSRSAGGVLSLVAPPKGAATRGLSPRWTLPGEPSIDPPEKQGKFGAVWR